ARVNSEPVMMVLLHADTSNDRIADAKQIKTWLESSGRATFAAN
ncbi:MAG: peptidase S11, partial [Aeromonas sp.]